MSAFVSWVIGWCMGILSVPILVLLAAAIWAYSGKGR